MSADIDYPDREASAYWAKWKFARLAVPLRERAKGLGYNLVVHGSLARDIDMVAVPWTEDAASLDVLVRALTHVCREHNDGVAFGFTAGERQRTEDPDLFARTLKPHGRIAVSIHVGGEPGTEKMGAGTYVDLSICPLSVTGGRAREADRP